MARPVLVPALVAGILVTLLCASLAATGGSRAGAAEDLVLRPFVTGLTTPVYLTTAHDGTGELYIVERGGTVRRADADGTLQPGVVLDISDQISLDGEHGLLSIAFRPGPGPKSDLFAYYVDTNRRITVSRFAFDGNVAGAETVLVSIEHGNLYHVGGTVAFGPDGMLYFATGDGGGSGGQFGHSQDPDSLLAKLLRIDPDAAAPATPEIVAMGFRNPFRFSFDGDTLYLADVGQDRVEEVNIIPVSTLGGEVENYGWNIMEGNECYNAETCDTTGLIPPDITYTHDEGCSIIGGYVYRGDLLPALRGRYIYSDYCTGTLFGIDTDESFGLGLAGFGIDDDGELYAIEMDDGIVFRFESSEPPPPIVRGPYRLIIPGVAADGNLR